MTNKMIVPRPVITVVGGKDRDTFAGIEITYKDKGEITELLDRLEGHAMAAAIHDGINWDASNTFMLGIIMPCGSRYLFRRAQDVPRETMQCDCGHPEHFVVLMSEQPAEIVRQPVWP